MVYPLPFSGGTEKFALCHSHFYFDVCCCQGPDKASGCGDSAEENPASAGLRQALPSQGGL